MSFYRGGERGVFACATIPDKQWVSTVYPNGKLQAIFSLIQIPHFTQTKNLNQKIGLGFPWRKGREDVRILFQKPKFPTQRLCFIGLEHPIVLAYIKISSSY